MIVQRANRKLEITQMTMGIYVVMAFIFYSFKEAFGIHPVIVWGLIGLSVIGIVYSMRLMMQNKMVVKPYAAWQASRLKTIRPNRLIRYIGLIAISMLAGVHFYIVLWSGNDVMPLVYDYGLGGIGAASIQLIIYRKWNIGLSDKGIIFGSKFDSKVIFWEEISSYHQKDNSIYIEFKKDTPIKSVVLTPPKQQREILLLIQQATQ